MSRDDHAPQAADPHEAAESLRASLAAAGIVLPSLAADTASPYLSLVTLGSVRADVALDLANALRRRPT
ncbi:hypothetical protein [Streptomyces sp. NBC_01465]|uniref:hypothetical protein n=1 Tax=Streptomyces sp. NBC_01465 TaxID=2903878 RepID=UPI002E2FD0D2|nr:hypothetical protein [Streptomyces sp. NBC_01465]